MNFVVISPNYPESYWMFCRGLKENGAKVTLTDGRVKNINNSDVLSFTYEYRDKRFTDEELKCLERISLKLFHNIDLFG